MFDVTVTAGLVYAATPDGAPLAADLYRPSTSRPPPVVIYVHGGGFAVGSRSDGSESRLAALAAYGVAVLSVDYRLAPAAHFPAPLHDVKAVVRWTRAHAHSLDLDGGRVGVWGASAGAILATLVGLTPGRAELDGVLGDHHDQSSGVDAVVAWFGSADLTATASRSRLEAEIVPFDFEATLLGVGSAAEVAGVADLARQASPLTWVHSEAPPFLVAHGDRDRVVPSAQSQALHDALVRVGARSSLLFVGGAGHESETFDTAENLALTAGFLSAALRSPGDAASDEGR